MRNVLITGGAGFIGSHVVRLFVNKYPERRIVNVDALMYAGNLANLRDVEAAPHYTFVRADICDFERMCEIMQEYDIDGVIHLAAESLDVPSAAIQVTYAGGSPVHIIAQETDGYFLAIAIQNFS